MKNESKLKMQRVDVLTNRGDRIDLLPWQQEAMGLYIPRNSFVQSLFRLKDGEIDCGLEVQYLFGENTMIMTCWLN